jgi:hypothetical protein
MSAVWTIRWRGVGDSRRADSALIDAGAGVRRLQLETDAPHHGVLTNRSPWISNIVAGPSFSNVNDTGVP